MANYAEKRIELQYILESILGSRNVYYQPPETIKIKYPAIIYTLDSIRRTNADSILYNHNCRYSLTYISKNPDDDKILDILSLPNSSLDRRYTADGLYHTAFTIFYK